MKHRNGFTLVELMIVIFLLAIISAIGGLALQNYTLNRNLRTAARDIASDFTIYKERAVSDSITYQIAFNTPAAGSYTIQSVVNGPVVTNLTTKSPSSFGSDISNRQRHIRPARRRRLFLTPEAPYRPRLVSFSRRRRCSAEQQKLSSHNYGQFDGKNVCHV